MSKKIFLISKASSLTQLLLAGLVLSLLAACQAPPKWVLYEDMPGKVYPGECWPKVKAPEQLGWSSQKLAEARAYSKKIGSAAVMIVDDGVVVDAWGDITSMYTLLDKVAGPV
jgi:hypothetical protein